MKHASSNILFFLKPKAETAYIYDYHTVRQALEIMEYHKYSSIPILSRDGKYVGSITEGDLLWGLKKLDLFNLKEAENISIMKVDRRLDYQCVTAKSKMSHGAEFCSRSRRPGKLYRYHHPEGYHRLLLQ